jgi:PhzF family phenazine biosynthesis protein
MLPKRVPYRLVDAFTDKPFQGNPAAVVLFEDDRIDDDQLLQMLAIEYNLQETAFLRRLDAANNPGEAPRYRLRWFTPVQEFPLCGHATLASAHYLLSEVHPQAKRISFETMSGTLHTTRSPSGTLELDFPADTSVLAAPDRETVQSIQKRLEGVNAALSQEVVDVRVGKLAVIVELRTSYDLATAELDALPLVRVFRSRRSCYVTPRLHS